MISKGRQFETRHVFIYVHYIKISKHKCRIQTYSNITSAVLLACIGSIYFGKLVKVLGTVRYFRLNSFPHTIILQQTTLNVFWQNIENLHNWMDNLWQKVENIVAKGEIARFVQFLLLSHYVFKKLSAAEASESVYMRERVNLIF